jgi:hypothetical protein
MTLFSIFSAFPCLFLDSKQTEQTHIIAFSGSGEFSKDLIEIDARKPQQVPETLQAVALFPRGLSTKRGFGTGNKRLFWALIWESFLYDLNPYRSDWRGRFMQSCHEWSSKPVQIIDDLIFRERAGRDCEAPGLPMSPFLWAREGLLTSLSHFRGQMHIEQHMLAFRCHTNTSSESAPRWGGGGHHGDDEPDDHEADKGDADLRPECEP